MYHIAQINIGRIKAPLDDPLMAGFVNWLAIVNAMADDSPGFVWRLQSAEGDATALRPYGDDRILVNMSVWESIEALSAFVYDGLHSQVMRQRRQWFERFEGAYTALWWVPNGHIPSIEEAKERLDHLQAHGPTPYAFTFKQQFPAGVTEPSVAAS
jgi:Domain of unknown function (DUF3291)